MAQEIPINDFAELSTSLEHVDPAAAAENLCLSAEALLDQCGRESTVNSIRAIVTPHMCDVTLDGKLLHARLARLQGTEDDLPHIVFDETAELTVVTSNYSAMAFREFAGDRTLTVLAGGEPLVNDSRYIKLADKIITTISEKAQQEKLAEATAKAARKHHVLKGAGRAMAAPYRYFTSKDYVSSEYFDNRGESRRVKAGLSLAALVLLYAHLPFGHIDAKIGPVPMPDVIEWIDDGINKTAHKAQGFAQPAGAASVEVGSPVGQVPLLPAYNTEGVPDATTTDGDRDSTWYTGEESQKGLYESDFDFAYHPKNKEEQTTAAFGPDGCYAIDGNFVSGHSYVFTQTPGFNDKVKLSVSNVHTLEVCKTDPQDKNFKGSVYIYRK